MECTESALKLISLLLNPSHLVMDLFHIPVLLPDAFVQGKLHGTAIGSHLDRALLKTASAEEYIELSFV